MSGPTALGGRALGGRALGERTGPFLQYRRVFPSIHLQGEAHRSLGTFAQGEVTRFARFTHTSRAPLGDTRYEPIGHRTAGVFF